MTLITCSVKWVQLSSQDSKEKTSWYSARREQLNLLALAAKILGHSSPTSQTAFPVSTLWSSFVSGILGLIQCIYCSRSHLHLRHPIGSYHSFWWDLLLQGLRVSCTMTVTLFCHWTSQCRCSVSSNLEAITLPQHAGSESSHSTSLQWMQSSSLHVWFWTIRHLLFCSLWWWQLHNIHIQ